MAAFQLNSMHSRTHRRNQLLERADQGMAMSGQHGVITAGSIALYTTAFTAIISTFDGTTDLSCDTRSDPLTLHNSPIVLDELISHSNALSFGFVKQAAPVAPAELVVDMSRLGGVAAQLRKAAPIALQYSCRALLSYSAGCCTHHRMHKQMVSALSGDVLI